MDVRSSFADYDRLKTGDDDPRDATIPALVLKTAAQPPPHLIPPRRWLYGTRLVRGFVTVLVAPGGTGKSSYAMAVGACCATGQRLLGEHVFERTNVVILNLEDPMEELDRRLAAIKIRHQLFAPIDGYYMHSSEDRPIAMAEIADDGFTVIYPDEDALIGQIKANRIGVTIVDPFSESHSLEENNTPHMVKAMAAWRRVARETDSAVMLIHHVRKGTSLDIDAARGAKAITDSGRVGLLMSVMTVVDAEAFGMPENSRHAYVRLDDAKANMAPKADQAVWFRLERIALENCTELYPTGDHVAAIARWEPPTPFEGLDWPKVLAILEKLQAGPEPGEMYSASKRGKSNERWAGHVICEIGERSDEQASAILKRWIEEKLLETGLYASKITKRQDTPGLTVNEAKLSEMRRTFTPSQFDC